MDPNKVAAVRNWPTPTMLREVRAFIGFSNFYRRFIQDFSSIARPLHDLTKKDMPWQWHEEQQKVFDTLKESFCREPILKGLRSRTSYKSRSRRVRLCNRGNSLSETFRRQMAPSSVSLTVNEQRRTQL